MRIEQDSARVRFPPPLVYLGTLLLGLAAERVIPLRSFGFDKTMLIVSGALLFIGGAAATLSAAGLFSKLGTNVEPWRPVTQIVSTGVFRWTRNPMYLGMALMYLGLTIGLDGPIALILLPAVVAVIQSQVIAREEAYLEAKFGDDYLNYKRNVRRWI